MLSLFLSLVCAAAPPSCDYEVPMGPFADCDECVQAHYLELSACGDCCYNSGRDCIDGCNPEVEDCTQCLDAWNDCLTGCYSYGCPCPVECCPEIAPPWACQYVPPMGPFEDCADCIDWHADSIFACWECCADERTRCEGIHDPYEHWICLDAEQLCLHQCDVDGDECPCGSKCCPDTHVGDE